MNTKFGEKIGFIGLGKLGMPCAEAIAKKGFDVAGYDTVKKLSNLIEIKNFGQKSAEEVIDALQKRLGINLPKERTIKNM